MLSAFQTAASLPSTRKVPHKNKFRHSRGTHKFTTTGSLSLRRQSRLQSDFTKPYARGSFGEVFTGNLYPCGTSIIIKRAHASREAQRHLSHEHFINSRISPTTTTITLLSSSSSFPRYLGFIEGCLVWATSSPHGPSPTLEQYLSSHPPDALRTALNAPFSAGPLRVGSFRLVLHGVLRALDSLHRSHALVHRDVKPSNVLIVSGKHGNESSKVQLIDFGAACTSRPWIWGIWNRIGHLHDPLYTAPEQRLCASAPDKFDVYSAALLGLRVLMPSCSAQRLSGLKKSIEEIGLRKIRQQVVAKGVGTDAFENELVALCREHDPMVAPLFQLLESMLVKNPARRISAKKALESPVFL